jgi:hypothetical protein
VKIRELPSFIVVMVLCVLQGKIKHCIDEYFHIDVLSLCMATLETSGVSHLLCFHYVTEFVKDKTIFNRSVTEVQLV